MTQQLEHDKQLAKAHMRNRILVVLGMIFAACVAISALADIGNPGIIAAVGGVIMGLFWGLNGILGRSTLGSRRDR